jgi:hypothetical protein
VAKDAAARFVEDEIAQCAVLGDEARQLPQGFARRRRNSADNHVADLTSGVAGDDVNDFRGSRGINGRPIEEVTDEQSINSGAAAASFRRSFGAPNRSRSEPQVTSAWDASELLYGGYAGNPTSWQSP